MMQGDQADIYACGDTHVWHSVEGENAARGFLYWLIRSRGYKFIDSYGELLGYQPQDYGASITAIINPNATGPQRIRCFPDLEEAAAYLTFLRSK
jgi:hypothetical protein